MGDHGDENFGILQKASADDFSENSSSSGSATDDSDSDSDDSDSSSSSSSSRQLEAGISERRSLISQFQKREEEKENNNVNMNSSIHASPQIVHAVEEDGHEE